MGVDKWKARHDRLAGAREGLLLRSPAGRHAGGPPGHVDLSAQDPPLVFRYGLPALLLAQLALGTWIVVRVFDLQCTGKAAPPLGGAAFFHGFFPSLCLVPSGSTI